MKLKTTVDVTCAEQGKTIPYVGKLVGTVLTRVPNGDGSLTINIEYQKEDLTPLMSIVKTYSAESVETLYQEIKNEITSNLNGVLSLNEQIMFAFKIEMASTFSISVNNIEIIA